MTNVDPERAGPRDPAEFVAAMRALKAAALVGFRTLEKRAEAAGDVLPRSTLEAVLRRDTLPREEVVAAFVRACGLGEEAVERWLAVHRRIAAGDPPDLAVPVEPPPPPASVSPPGGPPEPVVTGCGGACVSARSGWLADFVPPAIWRGSWALRVVAALLCGLVLLTTLAAVIVAIRDWASSG